MVFPVNCGDILPNLNPGPIKRAALSIFRRYSDAASHHKRANMNKVEPSWHCAENLKHDRKKIQRESAHDGSYFLTGNDRILLVERFHPNFVE